MDNQGEQGTRDSIRSMNALQLRITIRPNYITDSKLYFPMPALLH